MRIQDHPMKLRGDFYRPKPKKTKPYEKPANKKNGLRSDFIVSARENGIVDKRPILEYKGHPVEISEVANLKSRAGLFCAYTLGIFSLFILNGVCSEKLFRIPGFQTFGWYLTLIQFVFYVVLSATIAKLRNQSWKRRAPKRVFAAVAFFTVMTTGLSNVSVGYMNYPTQLVFKCCKIIPVMIGGIFIQGKRYGWLDFASSITMSVGLIFFSLADAEISPHFQTKGVVMVCLALVGDAVIGNLQEKVMKEYRISTDEMIFRCYTIGVCYILVGVVLTGELLDATKFCLSKPWETYPVIIVFAVTAYFGVNLILLLIQTFGAVAAVTVTTCRKALTICLSFMLFTKPFTMRYLWSGLLVLVGIYLSLYAKNKAIIDPRIKETFNGAISMIKSVISKTQSPPSAPSPSSVIVVY